MHNTGRQRIRAVRFYRNAQVTNTISRKYFILWDIVNPQLGSGLGLGLGLGSGLGLGLGLDSVRGSTISHKMKYLTDKYIYIYIYIYIWVPLTSGTQKKINCLQVFTL